jgi:hypothetical protein
LYRDSIKPGFEEFCVNANDFHTNVVRPGIEELYVSASEFNVNVVSPTLEPMLNMITEFAEDVAPAFKQLVVRGSNAIALTAEFAEDEVMPALKVMRANAKEFTDDVVLPALKQMAFKGAEIAEADVYPAIKSFAEDVAAIASQSNKALENYVKPGLKELGKEFGKTCGTAIANTSVRTEAFRKNIVENMEKKNYGLGVVMFWEDQEQNSTTERR